MNQRILLAALLGGLALFGWEAVAHMLTPLGTMGWKTLPNETAVINSLKDQVPDGGLYLFPAPDAPPQTTRPRAGMLLWHKDQYTIAPSQLLVQFVTDVLVMLIVGLLLAQMSPSAGFGSRIVAVLLMSLFATFRWGIPWINWYSFPRTLIAAAFVIDFVGFAIGGLVVAKLVQRRPRTMAAAS